MSTILGAQILFERGNEDGPPETFSLVGGNRGGTLDLNGNQIETSSADDANVLGYFRTFRSGPKTFGYSGDLLIKTEHKAQQQAMLSAFMSDDIDNYRITIPVLGVFIVPLQIITFDVPTTYDEVVSINASFAATAAPSFTPEA